MRKIVDSPMRLDAVLGEDLGCAGGSHDARAADHHVEAARRGVVDELGGELAHAVERGEVTFFSVDEGVVVAVAEVLDVVLGKDVRRVTDKED